MTLDDIDFSFCSFEAVAPDERPVGGDDIGVSEEARHRYDEKFTSEADLGGGEEYLGLCSPHHTRKPNGSQ